ncbi:uncharacterized protein BO72DRAFT_448454 [Aspergillus fijiensis CBS 313.89]|uniref:G-patch domain-containing protein n=1 Tax=Aspergillus fijiensis CBS 313.89 TaxID=1448319 RepID=A0A8G1RR40_9EURO|nr:uncharacterized protein BO72DRAFT_448454 [Aspergillus fijiensis CBS 313.89]RAK76763.1 hypothetical protein BO72DRAFT_448454 [Aspergillus fijiensis CBS 313.89]
MDAQAILLKLGWSGPGNPLNPNARPGATSGLGLTRPILVARRKGNSGVGNKTTKDPTNQWWLRGFEDALKGVGEERRTPADARTPNALTSELYRFFVRGEVVAGTLGEKHKDDGEGANGKRKREGDDEDDGGDDDDKNGKKRKEKKKETKEERKARKEERKKRKDERRVKREEKKKRKEEREARRADRKLRREKKAAAKLLKRRKEGEEDAPRPQYEDYPTPPMTEQEQEQTGDAEAGVKVKKIKEKKDRKDKKNKEEKKTPKESKKRKTREEASADEAPKKSKKSQAAE